MVATSSVQEQGNRGRAVPATLLTMGAVAVAGTLRCSGAAPRGFSAFPLAPPQSLPARGAEGGSTQTLRGFPGTSFGEPSSTVSWNSCGAAAAFVLGAAGAIATVATRDGSQIVMHGRHDSKTFKGKLHAHTFGKCRMGPEKVVKKNKLKSGWFEKDQPKMCHPIPEHTWDPENIMNNRLYYFTDKLREAWEGHRDEAYEWYRENWHTRMNFTGYQGAYKNWYPPAEEIEKHGHPGQRQEKELFEYLDANPHMRKTFAKYLLTRSRPMRGPPEAPDDPEDTQPPSPPPSGGPSQPEAGPSEPEAPTPVAEEKPKEEEQPKKAKKEKAPPAPVPEAVAEEAIPEIEAVAAPPAPEPEPVVEAAPPAPEPEPVAKAAPPAPEPEPVVEAAPPAPQPEPVVEAAPPAPEPEPVAKAAPPAPEPVAEAAPPAPAPAAEAVAPAPAAEAAPFKVDAKMVKDLRARSGAAMLDCKNALTEAVGDIEAAMTWLRKRGIAKADKKIGNVAVEGAVASYVHFNSKLGVICEVNSETDFVAQNDIFKEFTSDLAMQIAANPSIVYISSAEVSDEEKAKAKLVEMAKEDLEGKPDNVKEKIVEGRLKKQFEEVALMGQKWLKDEEKTVEEILKERIAKLGENLVIRRFARLTLGEGLEKRDTDFAGGVEKELEKYRSDPAAAPAEEPKAEAPKAEEKPKEEPKAESDKPAVVISALEVKELRARCGAGIADTKKALVESGGDMEKAMEWLKKKGMAKADKKAGNVSAEGAIATYVHFNNKIGVLVEVNSETDFVAINAIFKEFASDVAMQIAANPTVVCISTSEVPADAIAKEREIEMAKEDLEGKPDAVKAKIVEGRLKKKYEEMALLTQKWIKDEDKTVEQVLKETIAKLGENIIIRRFSRINLGEGLAKKEADFAAGVEKELEKYRA